MSKPDVRSTKEMLWLSCWEKQCCSHYTVMLTGRDMWHISRTMQLPPLVFTRYAEAPPDAEDGFALDGSGKHYWAMLAKRRTEEQSTGTCVFLLRLPNGHAQCALGDLRPTICESFPSILINGVLCIGDYSGCSCRAWSLSHVDIEQETALAQRVERERTEYKEIVQRWNRRVEQANDRQYSYMEFCNYLMNAYAERDQQSEQVEASLGS